MTTWNLSMNADFKKQYLYVSRESPQDNRLVKIHYNELEESWYGIVLDTSDEVEDLNSSSIHDKIYSLELILAELVNSGTEVYVLDSIKELSSVIKTLSEDTWEDRIIRKINNLYVEEDTDTRCKLIIDSILEDKEFVNYAKANSMMELINLVKQQTLNLKK